MPLNLLRRNRMAGPILQTDTKVAWASRNNSPILTRSERIDKTASTASPDTRSPRIIFPLAEHRFADTSPSPFPTSDPGLSRNPHNQSPFPASEGTTSLSSGCHDGPFDADGMFLPGMRNSGDYLQTLDRETMSAPPELHQLHRKITMDTPEARFSASVIPGRHELGNQRPSKMRIHSTPVRKHVTPSQQTLSTQQAIEEQMDQESHEFHLDRTAPIRALRHPPASASAGASGQFGNSFMGTIQEQRGQSQTPEFLLNAAKKAEPPEVNDEDQPERTSSPGQAEGENDKRAEEPPTWGETFRLQWVKTERLPFYRTRHLRNPWNHDREIKVSRDGTELEPSVGQALLEEWDRAIETHSTEKSAQQSGTGGIGGGRHQGRSKGGGASGGVQRGKK